MSTITATITFEVDGEVSLRELKRNIEDALERQMDNVGLSGDLDEGSVESFDVTFIELGE